MLDFSVNNQSYLTYYNRLYCYQQHNHIIAKLFGAVHELIIIVLEYYFELNFKKFSMHKNFPLRSLLYDNQLFIVENVSSVLVSDPSVCTIVLCTINCTFKGLKKNYDSEVNYG